VNDDEGPDLPPIDDAERPPEVTWGVRSPAEGAPLAEAPPGEAPLEGAPLEGAPLEGAPRRGVPWRGREAIVIFLLHLAGAALLTLPIALSTENEDTIFALATLFTGILLFVVTVAWVRIRHHQGPRSLGLQGLTPANVGIGVAVAAGGLIIASIISALIYTVVENLTGDPVGDPQQIPIDEPTTAQLWIIGISVVILAPIAEEVFFRGFLYPALRRWARPWPAILLSAGFFALAHVDWRVIPPIFALGMVLAWVVEKRRSLAPAIVGHMCFNMFGFVLLFVLD